MFPLNAIPHTAPVTHTLPLRAPGLDATTPLEGPAQPGQTQPASESFGSLLGKMVSEVNDQQNIAAEAVRSLQSGGNVSLHQAVIAMEEANVSFQLMVEVRNKMLEAYQELMRMQI